MVKISDRAEEILESLWIGIEQEKHGSLDIGIAKGSPEVGELESLGFIKSAHDKLTLTDKGRSEGQKVVRRHRLAERLFSDVLDIKKKLIHQVSCQFEHLLHEGIEDNICILLGHPKTCPHGRVIPAGDCCRKSQAAADKIISSLPNLILNQKSKVAYIHTKDNAKLQKLMAMGVLPGMSISLIQKFPSFVFQIGQAQFAVDKEIAENIYVRLAK